jgi:hypothetical protein
LAPDEDQEGELKCLSDANVLKLGAGIARLGHTLAVNPGSSYESGTLQGVVVDLLGDGKVKRYQLTVG